MSESDLVVLIPVLGRPHHVAPLLGNLASVSPDVRVLFLANRGDDAEVDALLTAGADAHVLPRTRRSFAMKVNDGYRLTTEPILMFCGDDVRFHPGWDDNALGLFDDPEAGVVGTNDLLHPGALRGDHSTHCLFRRSYIETEGGTAEGTPGRVMHEGYGHGYCDLEFTEVARARHRYRHAYSSIVEHRHHKNKARPFDATDAIARRVLPRSKREFRNRRPLWLRALIDAEA